METGRGRLIGELLPGVERTPGLGKRRQLVQTPGPASRENLGSHSPSVLVLGAGSLWEVSLQPSALPLVAGLISEADSLGTGSRFSSVESSSFKVQLKCHLLCKDSPSPRSKINHPSSVFPLHCVDTSRIVLSYRTRIYVFTSLSPQLTGTSRGQVPCRSAFMSLHLGQRYACSGCSINDE